MKIVLGYFASLFILINLVSCAKGTFDSRTKESVAVVSTLNSSRLPSLWERESTITAGAGVLKYIGTIFDYTDYYRSYKFDCDVGKDYNNGFVFSGTAFNDTISVYKYNELPKDGSGNVDVAQLCQDGVGGGVAIRENVPTLGTESKFYSPKIVEGDYYLAFKLGSEPVDKCNYTTQKINYRYKRVSSTQQAFAVIKENGTVVSFGNKDYGGDRSEVFGTTLPEGGDLGETQPVSIATSETSFAVLHKDGTVSSWYNNAKLEDGSMAGVVKDFKDNVASSLSNPATAKVVALFSNTYAFIALKEDGSITSWGYATHGGQFNRGGPKAHPSNSSFNPAEDDENKAAKKIVTVVSNSSSFAVIKTDGSIATFGGDYVVNQEDSNIDLKGSNYTVSQHPAGTLPVAQVFPAEGFTGKRVVGIVPTEGAYVAQTEDGHLVSWGDQAYGGNLENQYPKEVSAKDSEVALHNVVGNSRAFVALNKNGNIVSWGNEAYGGNLTTHKPSNVVSSWKYAKLYPGYLSFSAISKDGLLTTWGDIKASYTGEEDIYDSGNLLKFFPSRSLYNLTTPEVTANMVISTSSANAALLNNGMVIAWGNNAQGGSAKNKMFPPGSFDSLGTSNANSIWQIYSNWDAFAAVTVEGSLITWGKVVDKKDPTNPPASGSWVSAKPPQDSKTKFNGDSEIVKIYHTSYAFLALKKDGSFFVWGTPGAGGSADEHFPANALSNYSLK